ncbi:cilia- and flagella-associated protein 61-like isoform X2 [Bacillus rossius redtenbacheri]|uniref:cilia- and flagella-associated protein 61-like isoform X2 n=1 Tax=Bacillus rossius redtenbacheri TaxID=93214 RepID=UPI002FDC95AA
MAFYEAMHNAPNLLRFSRRVEHTDVPTVMNLFRDKVTKELFGNVNVSELIEMAYLSLAQLDSSSSGIVACLFLCDFPNVPAVPRGCWVDWLRQHYRLEQASAGNTLFVHLLVWEPSHTHQFLRPLLCSVFLELPRLRNIVVVVPPGAKKYDILDEFFTQIVPQPVTQHARVQTVLLCMRQQLVQRLKVRRAVEEDNDDLMPILDKTGRLKEQFGEFYVSDLIRTSDETRKMIVPEVLERAVGVMCVSSSVDYAQLDELFELGPFNGLKRSPALPLKPPATRVCADSDDQFKFSLDMLEAAFDCFPDLDYCIATLPSAYTLRPLLEHFMRVPTKTVCSARTELCVAHRNSFLSEMVVRRATLGDVPSLQALLGRIEKWYEILVDVMTSLRRGEPALLSFVITSEESVIGLAVIRGGEDVSYLWAHYQLERYALRKAHGPEQHGLVRHLVLSPAFNYHARFFLAEIHRQSDVTCLYAPLPHHSPSQGTVTVLGYMVPVLPRRRTEYDLAKLSMREPGDHVTGRRPPCALYHMCKRLSSLRKLAVGTRVVVLGASDAALGFLERLLFGPWCAYLTFCNVTLVSRYGLPSAPGRGLLPRRSRFSPAYLALLSLPTWVNVVHGDVTAIDRQGKNIRINDKSVLPYSYLLIFSDDEFLAPERGNDRVVSPRERWLASARVKEEPAVKPEPQNVFYINSAPDVARALGALNEIMRELQDCNIVVYGHNMEAFCCVAALLDHGLPGTCISFVEPFSLPSVTCFNDLDVYQAVLSELRKEGVKVFSGCHLHHWVVRGEEEPVVTTLAIEAQTYCFCMKCSVLFFYGNKEVSDELFNVLNGASLVYDGRLVINTQFQTNDPCILAAGRVTKYTRALWADKFNHCLYNLAEVGAKVADSMMKQWDPTRRQAEAEAEDSGQMPHVFSEPIAVSCVLPGRVNYLHVRRPGPSEPQETAMRKDGYGVVLLTGGCGDRNYFRLHLDALGKVETVTCYTDQTIAVGNLISLYGKHEKLCNNLLTRFESGRITDLYDYFSEPWAYALFHDQFESFNEKARHMYSPHEPAGARALAEAPCCDSELARRLARYLGESAEHLPMYADPRLLRLLTHEREFSPLHRKPPRVVSFALNTLPAGT